MFRRTLRLQAALVLLIFVGELALPAMVWAAKAGGTTYFKVGGAQYNVNTASAGQLAAGLQALGLKGQNGVRVANAIVAHRRANGSFKTLQDVRLVKGVGQATMTRLLTHAGQVASPGARRTTKRPAQRAIKQAPPKPAARPKVWVRTPGTTTASGARGGYRVKVDLNSPNKHKVAMELLRGGVPRGQVNALMQARAHFDRGGQYPKSAGEYSRLGSKFLGDPFTIDGSGNLSKPRSVQIAERKALAQKKLAEKRAKAAEAAARRAAAEKKAAAAKAKQEARVRERAAKDAAARKSAQAQGQRLMTTNNKGTLVVQKGQLVLEFQKAPGARPARVQITKLTSAQLYKGLVDAGMPRNAAMQAARAVSQGPFQSMADFRARAPEAAKYTRVGARGQLNTRLAEPPPGVRRGKAAANPAQAGTKAQAGVARAQFAAARDRAARLARQKVPTDLKAMNQHYNQLRRAYNQAYKARVELARLEGRSLTGQQIRNLPEMKTVERAITEVGKARAGSVAAGRQLAETRTQLEALRRASAQTGDPAKLARMKSQANRLLQRQAQLEAATGQKGVSRTKFLSEFDSKLRAAKAKQAASQKASAEPAKRGPSKTVQDPAARKRALEANKAQRIRQLKAEGNQLMEKAVRSGKYGKTRGEVYRNALQHKGNDPTLRQIRQKAAELAQLRGRPAPRAPAQRAARPASQPKARQPAQVKAKRTNAKARRVAEIQRAADAHAARNPRQFKSGQDVIRAAQKGARGGVFDHIRNVQKQVKSLDSSGTQANKARQKVAQRRAAAPQARTKGPGGIQGIDAKLGSLNTQMQQEASRVHKQNPSKYRNARHVAEQAARGVRAPELRGVQNLQNQMQNMQAVKKNIKATRVQKARAKASSRPAQVKSGTKVATAEVARARDLAAERVLRRYPDRFSSKGEVLRAAHQGPKAGQAVPELRTVRTYNNQLRFLRKQAAAKGPSGPAAGRGNQGGKASPARAKAPPAQPGQRSVGQEISRQNKLLQRAEADIYRNSKRWRSTQEIRRAIQNGDTSPELKQARNHYERMKDLQAQKSTKGQRAAADTNTRSQGRRGAAPAGRGAAPKNIQAARTTFKTAMQDAMATGKYRSAGEVYQKAHQAGRNAPAELKAVKQAATDIARLRGRDAPRPPASERAPTRQRAATRQVLTEAGWEGRTGQEGRFNLAEAGRGRPLGEVITEMNNRMFQEAKAVARSSNGKYSSGQTAYEAMMRGDPAPELQRMRQMRGEMDALRRVNQQAKKLGGPTAAEPTRAAPEVARGAPEVARGTPEVARGAPEVIESGRVAETRVAETVAEPASGSGKGFWSRFAENLGWRQAPVAETAPAAETSTAKRGAWSWETLLENRATTSEAKVAEARVAEARVAEAGLNGRGGYMGEVIENMGWRNGGSPAEVAPEVRAVDPLAEARVAEVRAADPLAEARVAETVAEGKVAETVAEGKVAETAGKGRGGFFEYVKNNLNMGKGSGGVAVEIDVVDPVENARRGGVAEGFVDPIEAEGKGGRSGKGNWFEFRPDQWKGEPIEAQPKESFWKNLKEGFREAVPESKATEAKFDPLRRHAEGTSARVAEGGLLDSWVEKYVKNGGRAPAEGPIEVGERVLEPVEALESKGSAEAKSIETRIAELEARLAERAGVRGSAEPLAEGKALAELAPEAKPLETRLAELEARLAEPTRGSVEAKPLETRLAELEARLAEPAKGAVETARGSAEPVAEAKTLETRLAELEARAAEKAPRARGSAEPIAEAKTVEARIAELEARLAEPTKGSKGAVEVARGSVEVAPEAKALEARLQQIESRIFELRGEARTLGKEVVETGRVKTPAEAARLAEAKGIEVVRGSAEAPAAPESRVAETRVAETVAEGKVVEAKGLPEARLAQAEARLAELSKVQAEIKTLQQTRAEAIETARSNARAKAGEVVRHASQSVEAVETARAVETGKAVVEVAPKAAHALGLQAARPGALEVQFSKGVVDLARMPARQIVVESGGTIPMESATRIAEVAAKNGGNLTVAELAKAGVPAAEIATIQRGGVMAAKARVIQAADAMVAKGQYASRTAALRGAELRPMVEQVNQAGRALRTAGRAGAPAAAQSSTIASNATRGSTSTSARGSTSTSARGSASTGARGSTSTGARGSVSSGNGVAPATRSGTGSGTGTAKAGATNTASSSRATAKAAAKAQAGQAAAAKVANARATSAEVATKVAEAKASTAAAKGAGKGGALVFDAAKPAAFHQAKVAEYTAQIEGLKAGGGKGILGRVRRFADTRKIKNLEVQKAYHEGKVTELAKAGPEGLAAESKKIAPKGAHANLIKGLEAQYAKVDPNSRYGKALGERINQLKSTPNENFARSATHLALIAIGTNMFFNVWRQVKDGEGVDLAKAGSFLTDSSFWLSTAGMIGGVFVGQKIAQMTFWELLSTRVMGMTPLGGTFMRLLPAFAGGALGATLASGGVHDADWGSIGAHTIGSTLGTAIAIAMFASGPIGQLVGAIAGGMLAEKLLHMIRGDDPESHGTARDETGADDPLADEGAEAVAGGSGETFTTDDVELAFSEMQNAYQAYRGLEEAGNYGEAAVAYERYMGLKRQVDGMRQTSYAARN